MTNIDMRQIYNFYPIEPAPEPADSITGGDIYYECLDCSGVVSSLPFIKVACECGNLTGNSGSVVVQNVAQIRAVRGTLK